MEATGRHDETRARRIELILEQIDSLPTLPSVAARLLRVSSSADADFRQIVSVIESDPALTAKILGLCRRADRRRAHEITTVDRAVVFLGFEAVRAAALSVNIYDLLAEPSARDHRAGPGEDDAPPLDRKAFWRHSIATACAAEAIAMERAGDHSMPKPSAAFVCGLLHGVGVLALEHALPRAYARVLQIALRSGQDLASVERNLIGIDHHTAGRRLAERWDLPPVLHDAIWLTGLPVDALADQPNRKLIAVMNLAVAIARRLHLGWSGDPTHAGSVEELCESCGVTLAKIAPIERRLHEDVAARASILGLDSGAGPDLLLESIAQANRELERMRAAAARGLAQADRRQRLLTELATFTGAQARTLGQACDAVARSAASILQPSFLAIARQPAGGPWEIRRFISGAAGIRPLPSLFIEAPAPWEPVGQSLRSAGLSQGSALEIAAAVGAQSNALALIELPDASAPAVLIHDGMGETRDDASLVPLFAAWSLAIEAGARADEARTAEEAVTRAAQGAADLRRQIDQAQALHHAVAVAAGAAAELARPIAAIKGRTELLLATLDNQRDIRSVEAISAAADRLAALNSTLRLFVDPPRLAPAPAEMAPLLGRAIRDAMKRVGANPRRAQQPRVRLLVDEAAKRALTDAESLALAMTELVANALESPEVSVIEVRAYPEPESGRLVISVKDDGQGMTPEAVRQAFEPFVFQKKQGNRRGVGLLMAHRLVHLLGGELALTRAEPRGLLAAIRLDPTRSMSPAEKPAAPARQAA